MTGLADERSATLVDSPDTLLPSALVLLLKRARDTSSQVRISGPSSPLSFPSSQSHLSRIMYTS